MNRDALQKRLELLTAERIRLVAEYEKLAANINALNGGIAEVNYWLSQVPLDEDGLKTLLGADSVKLMDKGE